MCLTNLLSKLSTYVTEPFRPIKARRLKTAISQHLCHLSIFYKEHKLHIYFHILSKFILSQLHNF